MSAQDNCTLSSGHPWTRAICGVCIDFSFPTLYFSYLTVFLFVFLSTEVGFELLSPHFEKFKSKQLVLINAQSPRSVSLLCLCVLCRLRPWPPTLYSRSPSSHSSCCAFAVAFVTRKLSKKINSINIVLSHPVAACTSL